MVKCTSGAINLLSFYLLALYLFSFSIFLASSGSFIVKNDNIHSFFSRFWLQILNLPASLQNKNARVGPFRWKRSVLQNPDRERTNQSTGICLRMGLPYNKKKYSLIILPGPWRPAVFKISAQFSKQFQIGKEGYDADKVSCRLVDGYFLWMVKFVLTLPTLVRIHILTPDYFPCTFFIS